MRALASVCAALIVSLSAATASADGWYFTEGFGPTTIDNQLSERTSGDAHFSVRLAAGRRFERWALEAFMMATELSTDDYSETAPPTLTGYGLSARYNFPLSRHIEVYLRGGLHKSELTVYEEEYSGRAVHYGAGIHLKGKVRALGFLFTPLFFTGVGPKVTASLFAETNQQFTRLHRDGRASIDADLSTIVLGFGVGSDF